MIKRIMVKDLKLLKIIIFIIFSVVSNNILADTDYPQSEMETKWEDFGSIAGGEGLVFRPGRTRNESTKAAGCSINRYLWQASIETLSFAPIASVDSNSGVIITDWYSPPTTQNYRFKINIFIKDDIIHPDSIEVKIFEEIFKNNRWILNKTNSNFAFTLEDKILRRARALYINSNQK